MRTKTFWIGLPLLFAMSVQADTTTEAVDDWYLKQYAPLWKEKPWEKVKEGAVFYDETLYLHPPDGPITPVDSREWLARSLEGWKSDGWLGSDVAELRSNRLNPTTVAFKARWRDWYTDGTEEFSCGWYLADLKGDRWVFTQYAEIDCAEHDL